MRTTAETMRKDVSKADARMNRIVKAQAVRTDSGSLMPTLSSSSLVGAICRTMLIRTKGTKRTIERQNGEDVGWHNEANHGK